MAVRKLRAQEPLSVLNAAIEGISYSLGQMKDLDTSTLSGPMFIDLTARLNAQINALDHILDPMKEQLKAEALNGSPILKGNNYQAEVRRIVKTVMDNDKIKAFLGKNLFKYQKERSETSLSFSVKE